MKRSRRIANLALGGVCLIALSACDETPPKVHANAEACAAATGDAETCKKAEEEARANHLSKAPRFKSFEECEAQFGFGKCGEVREPSGGGWIMPALAGFMMGRSFGGMSARPVYTDSRGFAYSDGKRLNQREATTSYGASSAAGRTVAGTASATSPVQRGGFGSTSRSFSSAGS